MSKLKEKDIQSIIWRDISIQKDSVGNNVLILICEEKKQSQRLLQTLHDNLFKLGVYIKKSGEYQLRIEFENSDYIMGYDTERTAETYPPLKLLSTQQVTYITTGIWTGVTEDGFRMSWHSLHFKPLSSTINYN